MRTLTPSTHSLNGELARIKELRQAEELQFVSDNLHKLYSLTLMEYEIFQLICTGSSNRNIATKLSIPISEVMHYRVSLMDKLGAHDLLGLLKFAQAFEITQISYDQLKDRLTA